MKIKLTEEQFKIKYNLYVKELFRISFGYTKNKQDSEDILQNVFLKYLNKELNFKTLNDEKYWLIRVTINESIDFIKRNYNNEKVLNNEIIANSYRNNFNHQIVDDIYYCLEKMSEKYKRVLILYYFDDLCILDISKILNISESAVKMRLKRAKSNLKNEMEGINHV